MTRIDAAVRSKLLASTAVTALVSTRIYTDSLPDNVTLPAISVHPITDLEDENVPDAMTARVQVSCWSNPVISGGQRSPNEIENIADAVEAAISKTKLEWINETWTIGTKTYTVTGCRAITNARIIDDPSGWLHKPVDFMIEFRR